MRHKTILIVVAEALLVSAAAVVVACLIYVCWAIVSSLAIFLEILSRSL